jgi:hypothetical protein
MTTDVDGIWEQKDGLRFVKELIERKVRVSECRVSCCVDRARAECCLSGAQNEVPVCACLCLSDKSVATVSTYSGFSKSTVEYFDKLGLYVPAVGRVNIPACYVLDTYCTILCILWDVLWKKSKAVDFKEGSSMKSVQGWGWMLRWHRPWNVWERLRDGANKGTFQRKNLRVIFGCR